MISVTGSVGTLLASRGPFFFCDCYTINLLSGIQLLYTSADQSVTFGGTTWLGNALRIERSKIKLVRGVQVDALTVDCYPMSTDLIGGNPFVQLALNGGLDGAKLQLDRGVSPGDGQALTGIVPKRFIGRIAEVQGGRSKLTLTVKSDLDLMNIQMPRVLWQPPCSHSLYDAGCTLSRGSFTTSGAAAAGTLTASAFTTNLTQADGYFALGALTFTSGPNTGLFRSVKAYVHASGLVTMMVPFPVAPTAGNTFTIYPGCDKTFNTCNTKFANQQNFRGFEFVPDPEVGLI